MVVTWDGPRDCHRENTISQTQEDKISYDISDMCN